jgi:apolipoprotein N-acyltransferase
VEWIKAHFPFGLAFPWLGLGITLARWPELLGLAECVGEAGISFWLAGVNGLVAAAILHGPSVPRVFLVAGAALIPSLVGVVRARSLSFVEGPEIVAVGTFVPRELRQRPSEAGREALAQIESHLGGAGPLTADLVVLPEATAPYPMGSGEAGSTREYVERLSSDLDAPVVVGGLGEGARPGDLPTNSAFLFGGGGGESQRYDKIRLVPGMEAGAYLRGSLQEPLVSDGLVLGPLICYESLFGSLARKSRRYGAQLLLNLSSDIWFGEEGSLPGSLFLDQHPAHLVMRAVENRIPVARAANGGYTFILDPVGRVVSDLIPPEGGLARARIPIFHGMTLFTRTGDWLGPASLAVSLLLLAGWVPPGLPSRKSRQVCSGG